MAVNYNPKVIVDGLVLSLDAGNIKSYSGTGTTWTDLSGNNVGTIFNSPVYQSSIGYFDFQGSPYVNINSNPSLGAMTGITAGSNTFTISAWIKPTGNVNYGAWFIKQGSGARLDLGLANGTDWWCTTYNATSGLTDQGYFYYAIQPDATKWYNVVLVCDLNFKAVYINCVKQNFGNGSPTFTSSWPSDSNAAIIGGDRKFNGSIAQVQIYNKALSAAEVTQNYNAMQSRYVTPQLVIDSSLKLWIDANNTSSYPGTGTTITDLSGNGNTQNLNNSAAYTTLSGIKCWDCSTTAYQIQAAIAGPTLPTTGFTYTIWARMIPSTSNWRTLLRTNPDDHPILIESGSNRLGMYHNSNGGFFSAGYDVAALASVWAQWAITGDSTGQKFYINGIQVGSTTAPGTAAGFKHEVISAGASYGQPFGHIAQTQLYTRTLSATEINQNYNATRGTFGV